MSDHMSIAHWSHAICVITPHTFLVRKRQKMVNKTRMVQRKGFYRKYYKQRRYMRVSNLSACIPTYLIRRSTSSSSLNVSKDSLIFSGNQKQDGNHIGPPYAVSFVFPSILFSPPATIFSMTLGGFFDLSGGKDSPFLGQGLVLETSFVEIARNKS